MSIAGIEALAPFSGAAPTTAAQPSGVGDVFGNEVNGPQGPSANFGDLLTSSIDQLEYMNDRTDALAVQAATGDLNAIHDYTIAATESSVATQLTVTVRNKAVEAFNEIMRMPV
jgi:flagellar hook-basal body complex protein FliE